MKANIDEPVNRIADALSIITEREARVRTIFEGVDSKRITETNLLKERRNFYNKVETKFSRPGVVLNADEKASLRNLRTLRNKLDKQVWGNTFGKIATFFRRTFASTRHRRMEKAVNTDMAKLSKQLIVMGIPSALNQMKEKLAGGYSNFEVNVFEYDKGKLINYNLKYKTGNDGKVALHQTRIIVKSRLGGALIQDHRFDSLKYEGLNRNQMLSLMAGRPVFMPTGAVGIEGPTGNWLKVDFNDKDINRVPKIMEFQGNNLAQLSMQFTALPHTVPINSSSHASMMRMVLDGIRVPLNLTIDGQPQMVSMEIGDTLDNLKFYNARGEKIDINGKAKQEPKIKKIIANKRQIMRRASKI
ncbi:hypothetical protein [Pedobacter paludis]|uniref:Uncharacterized protein n=1 Tax=Pedobacter paludis TaxID=2203212 RepID=A0A317EYY0_9SPHI|nr:hypothetical protein [Pedobacter paludis]PWS32180.1 hypothetical protein DF947_10445 [Pedobacter paludis]